MLQSGPFPYSRYPLKFTIEDTTNVQLYPEEEEPVNILNIKRGIISALMAPVIEEEQSSLMVSNCEQQNNQARLEKSCPY